MTQKRKRVMKLAQSIKIQRNDFPKWIKHQLKFNNTYNDIIDFLIIGKLICNEMKRGDNIWDEMKMKNSI